MTLTQALSSRAEGRCELCKATTTLSSYDVSYAPDSMDATLAICAPCEAAMEEPTANTRYWRCLTDAMWAPVPAVQVLCWRLLKAMDSESWAQAALESLYLDDELQR